MSIEVAEKRISNTVIIPNQTEIKPIINKSVSDTADLSDSASTLKSLPINLSTSKISEGNNNIYFDFSFNAAQFQKVTANGYYSSKEKNLSINMKFILEKQLYEDGQIKTEKFQIEFSIDYSNIEISLLENKVEKENINNFLNRVMKEVNEILNDDKKNISGIIFDKDDLQELMQMGDKEVGKFLDEIILLIQTLAKIKKYKNHEVQNILLTPKRITHEILESRHTKNNSVEMKMTISKLLEE